MWSNISSIESLIQIYFLYFNKNYYQKYDNSKIWSLSELNVQNKRSFQSLNNKHMAYDYKINILLISCNKFSSLNYILTFNYAITFNCQAANI